VDQLEDEQWQTLHRRWCRWLEQMEQEAFALQTNPDGSYRVWGEGPAASTHDSLALALGKFYQARLGQRVLAKAQEELRQKIVRWRSKEESELTDNNNGSRPPKTMPRYNNKLMPFSVFSIPAAIKSMRHKSSTNAPENCADPSQS
jgi:succinylglutamate desuccinylase